MQSYMFISSISQVCRKRVGLILKSYLSQTQRKQSHSLSLPPNIVWWPHEWRKGPSPAGGPDLQSHPEGCPSHGESAVPTPIQTGVCLGRAIWCLSSLATQAGTHLEILLFQKESERALSPQCRPNGLSEGAGFRLHVVPSIRGSTA